MSATSIDGKSYATDLAAYVSREVDELTGRGIQPGLGTVMAGDSYPAQAYERRVRRLAERLGIRYVRERLPADVDEAEAVATVGKLDADPRVSGILVLRPLPEQVSEVAVYRALDPLKDIEAMHPVNAGLLALGRPRFVPSTPASVFHLLDRYVAERGDDPATFYAGRTIVVIGRSNNVGKPAVLLGFARDATVIACDVHTYDAGVLFDYTRRADILIVAAGVPGLISGEHVRDGVIAVDVGINPLTDPETGKIRLVGDLDTGSVASRAEAVTPVPGGVGPITDVWLVHNTAAAARLAADVVAAQPSLDGLTVAADTG